jgi:hypothetical protein
MKMTYSVLRFSQPASPRRDVRLSKIWRLAWVNVSKADADRWVDAAPARLRSSFKIVPAADVRKYL